MAPTSDERREVAERLRSRGDDLYSLFYTRLARRVFGDAWGNKSENEIFDKLADLIDPTCHLVGTTSEEGLYDGLTIFRHELSCGHTCETVWLEPPAYCDVCGARVVSDDDQ